LRLDDEIGELRKELQSFRVETRQRLELIEGEVTKQVSLNYNRAIVDYLQSATLDFIDTMKCEKGEDAELRCKEKMRDIQRKYLELLKVGKLRDSLGALKEAIEVSTGMVKGLVSSSNSICAECMRKEIDFLEINGGLLSQLTMLQEPMSPSLDDRGTVGSLDPVAMEQSILDPVAHRVRLQVMLSIFKGENRFADFTAATGLKGGHLLYHLNKLLEGGLIQQYESKDYVLTRKGLKTLVLLAQMGEELASQTGN
jgi:DNA-binding HxlR family transcriptional regulator